MIYLFYTPVISVNLAAQHEMFRAKVCDFLQEWYEHALKNSRRYIANTIEL